MNRWYVVARDYQWDGEQAWSDKVPFSLMHAKEVGTHLTACGQRCESWMKWYDLRFAAGGRSMCPECSRVVNEATSEVG